ncbi:MAG: TraX family protein [Eubacteriales bacterium]|nr:TraX family protein [Eubacteriales bacterium]
MGDTKRGIFDSFTLKMIAIITMLIDHIGYTCIPMGTSQYTVFRAIGRIAFPIFCFLIVEGFYHTRSHLNYLIRLAIFAILSEIPFDLAFRHTMFDWGSQNVFFTLMLGLLSLFCLEEINNRRVFVIPLVLIWAGAYFIQCDYGLGGVLLIDMFYHARKTPIIRAILAALLLYLFFGKFELWGLIAIPLIMLYNGKKGPSIKMLFYWFYPVHLMILYLIN